MGTVGAFRSGPLRLPGQPPRSRCLGATLRLPRRPRRRSARRSSGSRSSGSRRGWRLLAVRQPSAMALVGATARGEPRVRSVCTALMVVVASYLYAQERLRVGRRWKWAAVLVVGAVGRRRVRHHVPLDSRPRSMGRAGGDERHPRGRGARPERSAAGGAQPEPLERRPWSSGGTRLVRAAWTASPRSASSSRTREALRHVTEEAARHRPQHPLATSSTSLGACGSSGRTSPPWASAEQIGGLYYGTEHTSPAVTYMGDLYRNFGWARRLPWDVPHRAESLRALYAWLIEGHVLTGARVGIFFITNAAVGYEGLYSTYFPSRSGRWSSAWRASGQLLWPGESCLAPLAGSMGLGRCRLRERAGTLPGLSTNSGRSRPNPTVCRAQLRFGHCDRRLVPHCG